MIATEITVATSQDLPGVLELLEAVGLPDAGLSDCLGTLVVAREAGRVVGSAAMEMYGDAALLRSVATHPSVRGRGLGQRVTGAALDLARDCGPSRIYLLTETAEGFFGRFGFTRVERTEVPASVRASIEFTEACPESALAMELSLPS